MTTKNRASSSRDGDLHVARQGDPLPNGDCPPDVYAFRFGARTVHLCIACCVKKANKGEIPKSFSLSASNEACEDCGSATTPKIAAGGQQ